MNYLGPINDSKDIITREFNDHYGVCSTAAGTQAKTVEIPSLPALYEGAHITVKFTNNQTYNGAPTLNVNGLGAVNIRRTGATNAARYEWLAGEILDFVYDGNYWIIKDGGFATTSYYGVTKLSSSATSTGTTLAATPSAINATMQNIVTGLPVYSTSATYAVGDRVRYGTGYYECITAIETAEAWNAGHWTMLDPLLDMIDDLKVRYGTTEHWNADITLVAARGVIYVYSDHAAITEGGTEKNVPGIKIGDGTSYLIDMPFVGDEYAAQILAHVSNTAAHITAAERTAWNAKVSAGIDGEILVLSNN